MDELLNKLLELEKHPKNSKAIQGLLNQAIKIWLEKKDRTGFSKFMIEYSKYPQIMR